MRSHSDTRVNGAKTAQSLSQQALLTRMTLTAWVAAVALSLSMALASTARADTGAEIVWTATKVEGAVTYREGGHSDTRWAPLRQGALLSALVELKTGSDGRAELSFDGSTIVAAPNSEFKLPGPTPRNAVYRVSQKLGTFLYKIKHATRDKFEVQTPFLTTIIKGTIFTVLAGPAGSSVHVTEGAVFVQPATGTGGAFVRPGETARVTGSDRGKVSVQGANGKSGSSAAPKDDRRSDAAEPDKRPAKPVKIVFRGVAGQVTSSGDSAPFSPGANRKKAADTDVKGQDKAALRENTGPVNGSRVPGNKGVGNGNPGVTAGGNLSVGAGAGIGQGNSGGHTSGGGLGNGNAGGNTGVAVGVSAGLGNGNAGGNTSGGGLGNGNAGGGVGVGGRLGNGNAGGGVTVGVGLGKKS